jgi:hypothetical protein
MKKVMHNAIIKAIRATSVDSVRNWPISVFLSVPNTFRMPTSFALLEDLAVKDS